MFDFFHIKVESGKVDGQRLCITGRSAGGYTTLASLAFRDTFKAGASLYGVSFRFLESTIVFAINICQICVFILFLLSTCIYSILAEQFTIYCTPLILLSKCQIPCFLHLCARVRVTIFINMFLVLLSYAHSYIDIAL
jgi:hypothetical protein